jgi:hypothetical protein
MWEERYIWDQPKTRHAANLVEVEMTCSLFSLGSFPRGGTTQGFEAKSLWDKNKNPKLRNDVT